MELLGSGGNWELRATWGEQVTWGVSWQGTPCPWPSLALSLCVMASTSCAAVRCRDVSALEPADRGLKPLKTGAKINLAS